MRNNFLYKTFKKMKKFKPMKKNNGKEECPAMLARMRHSMIII